jgi:hypothetical protein
VCCGLGTVLAFVVLSGAAVLLGNPSGTNLEGDAAADLNTWLLVVDGLTSGLLLAGVVSLYRVPYGPRWRWASALLLVMSGADVAFLSLRAAGTDSKVLAISGMLGAALGWVELWMLAVLSAEAAEAAERPDLTHQTEVVGKLVIWGAFAWLLSVIWSFDLEQFGDASARMPQDLFTMILTSTAMLLHLIVMARATMCCMGLVGAYGPVYDEVQPN